MPELNITPEDIGPKRFRVPVPMRAYLKAVMLWPDDTKREVDSMHADAAEEIFRQVGESRSAPGDMVTISISAARALYRAPSQPSFQLERARRVFHGAIIGGAVMRMLLSPEAKLAAMLASATEALTKRLAEARVGTEEITKMLAEVAEGHIPLEWRNFATNVWHKLRPAAHLWAAWHWDLCGQRKFHSRAPSRSCPSSWRRRNT